MTEPETSGIAHDESDEDASEAQAQVIASLRAQVTDLFSQVTQLNGKLVASYDRVSDLEDQLHDASSSLRNASVTISSLELERSHHLAALNTGLLVEKAHVTTELNRLMERATDEAAQRGQAESARRDIEKDLDDLSASLFDQANTMVAEARLNQAKSERKVQDAEQALKIAEDAVKDMQVQMQTFQAEKETAEREVREVRVTMGKGKWVERDESRVSEVSRIRFMTTHAPYAEFVTFVGHLRGLRVSQPTPPVISTLLSQPFIARLINEDSEPTVRLDLAPSLNWLSRRSVLTAIHTGMLTVEPVPFSSLVQELHQHPPSTSTSTLSCALCGTLIARIPSATPMSRTHSSNGSSWFKYPLALGSSQNHNAGTPKSAESEPPGQVYIFRLAAATVSSPPPALAPIHSSSMSMPAVGISSRPPLNITSSRVIQTQSQNAPHPLCTSNYCLTRLRSTCSLWAFVRVGIVERIWEEDIVQPPKPHVNGDSTHEMPSSLMSASTGNQPSSGATLPLVSEKPPVPPRRRRLWEMASALSERAVSWGKESAEIVKDKDKDDGTKRVPPPPPPSHPPAPHPRADAPVSPVGAPAPPPLPKRSVVRGAAPTDTVVSPSSSQNSVVTTEFKEPTPHTNGHVDPQITEPDSPLTPIEDVTFATPPSETESPLTSTTFHPIVAAGSSIPSVPPIQESGQPIPPSPRAVPLPATPIPIARATSPVARPRSRLSSPASPPQSSRPASPAMSRSRAGSPVPSPGHVSSVSASPMRGRGSVGVSSPLAPGLGSRPASPAPASGAGAPPLPRRAPARRAVRPPPSASTSGGTKVVGESKEEAVATTPAAVSPVSESKKEVPFAVADVPEAGPRKASEVEVAGKKGSDVEGDGEDKEENISQVTSAPATTIEAVSEPVTVSDTDMRGDTQRAVNGLSATVVSDPHPPPASERDSSLSVGTASTKHSSSTEEEGFASDATWEERTWKELVRLKEEMFWARTGGIRALQG